MLLDEQKSEMIIEIFLEKFPLTFYGRIDWKRVDHAEVVELKGIMSDEEEVFIIWSDTSLPVIQCDGNTVGEFIEDILSVSFDTWIFIKNKEKVVEFYHDGQVTLGQVSLE